MNVNAGATLAFNRSNAPTVVNTINGAGAITQIGSGVTTLGAASSTVGIISVTAGTLDVDGTLNTGTLSVGNGILNIDGTVQASGATQTAIANIAGSATTININNGATLLASGDLGDGADRLRLQDDASVIGALDGGAGIDQLTLAGLGSGDAECRHGPRSWHVSQTLNSFSSRTRALGR